MKVTNMKITDIHPYEKNPRFNDEAVEAVAKSLKEFGWQQREFRLKSTPDRGSKMRERGQ